MNPNLIEDILSLVSEKPVLFNDLVSSLRGGLIAPFRVPSGRRWRNLNPGEIEGTLREYGAYFACRPHGSGLAVYVSSREFAVVNTRHGLKPVREY